MKKTLKIVSVLLILALCLPLAGCFSSEEKVEYKITEEQWKAAFEQQNYTEKSFTYDRSSQALYLALNIDCVESIVKHAANLSCRCDQTGAAIKNDELKALYGINSFEDYFGGNTSTQSTINTSNTSMGSNTDYSTDDSYTWDTGDSYKSDDTVDTGEYYGVVDYEILGSTDDHFASFGEFEGGVDIEFGGIGVNAAKVMKLGCAVKHEGEWYVEVSQGNTTEEATSLGWVNIKDLSDMYAYHIGNYESPCEFSQLTYDEREKAYVYCDDENNEKHYYYFENGVLVKSAIIECREEIDAADIRPVPSAEGDYTLTVSRYYGYGKTTVEDNHGFSADKIIEYSFK